MAKINTKRVDKTVVKNYEGAPAFKMEKKLELYSRVASCLWREPKFYGKKGDTEEAIVALINELMPDERWFILKLAVYAREQLYLRTVPQVLLAEVLGHESMKGKTKDVALTYGTRIIARADEMGSVVAYYNERFGKPFPEALKKIIRKKLMNITEYEALKYSGNNRDWSLRDLLRMFRPKAETAEQNSLFRYIVTGEADKCLELVNNRKRLAKKTEWDSECEDIMREGGITWEFAISHFGNKPEIWNALNLPFMAMLRNLRNLIESKADISRYIERLNNREAVIKSKQFPFRFWSAYKALVGYRKNNFWTLENHKSVNAPNELLDVLSEAMEFSIVSLPDIGGKTLIAVDSSGSMEAMISEKSTISMKEVGFSLGAILHKMYPDVTVYSFGHETRIIPMLKKDSMLTFIEKCCNVDVGHSTNAHLPVLDALNRREFYDRIIVVSDMQVWNDGIYGHRGTLNYAISNYRENINKDVKVIVIDVAGYGTTPVRINEKNVLLLAGWSDRIFNVIKSWEESAEDALDLIAQYE